LMRTKAMRLSGKLQMAKNRKHYCRSVLRSCDFQFGVGQLVEQRRGHCSAWAEGQRRTVPKSHVHACFKTPGICNCLRVWQLEKKIVCDSCTLAGLENWGRTTANRSAEVGLSCAWKREECKNIMKSDACLHLLDLRAAERHRDWCSQQGWSPLTDHTWRQPVGFASVPDAGLTSVAIIPSLGLAPFALAAAIQAPLAPQLSYASVAKSAAYQAVRCCRWPRTNRKKKLALLWQVPNFVQISAGFRNVRCECSP